MGELTRRRESSEYEGLEKERIKAVVGFGGNLKVDCHWLRNGSHCCVIGPRGICQSYLGGHIGKTLDIVLLAFVFVWWRFELPDRKKSSGVNFFFMKCY